jgi:hypothetical protein
MKKIFFIVKVALAASGLIVILILLGKNYADDSSLVIRIKDYETRADSLRIVVRTIDAGVHQKDSILLVYLASLDKTLEELNKESGKNKRSIEASFSRQDSVREGYCRAMANLEQCPEECK